MAIARALWSETSRTAWLLLGSAVLVLAFLGTGELWTHEGRWAVICLKMMETGKYFHPYQFDEAYYDKPLLSYWIIIGFARALGGLHEWTLRLPSALAAVLSIWCTYRIGARLFDRATGLLAGWVLTTSAMFVFWGRIASADMLNVLGTIGAVAWYVERRDKPGWLSHSLFWLILGVACQTKGLVAAVVAYLAVLPDLLMGKRWRSHLRPSLFLSLVPAVAVYIAPFFASSLLDPKYEESGLWQVFRENVLRYFAAYDHQNPPYSYFLWLPGFLIPWSLLLPWVIWRAVRRWKDLSPASRWLAWANLLVFLMFTASGSRRSYYILPMLPLTALWLADWLRPREASASRLRACAALATAAGALILVWFCIAIPYSLRLGGFRLFAQEVKSVAETRAPWEKWNVLLVDISPHSGYYLHNGRLPHNVNFPDRNTVTAHLKAHPRTIVVTRRTCLAEVLTFFDREPQIVPLRSRLPEGLRSLQSEEDAAVALIP